MRRAARPRTLLPLVLLLLICAAPPVVAPARADDPAGDAPDELASDLADAQVLLDAGLYRAALDLLAPTLALDPPPAAALGLNGKVRLELGQFQAALSDLARAAELDPAEWGDAARRAEALVAFYYGDDERLAQLLGTFTPDDATKHLGFLAAPPRLSATRLKGAPYRVYADEALVERGGEAYAGKLMGLVHKAYAKVFPFKKDERLVSRVYVFGASETFNAFSLRLGEDMSDAVGFYDPVTRILVIDADPGDAPVNAEGFSADAVDTMFHEGFHQFAHVHVPQGLPTWFDEGLAEYFGPSRLRGKGQLEVGVVVRTSEGVVTRYEVLKQALAAGADPRPFPLARLLTIEDEAFATEGRAELDYAHAWSVIHFLLHDPALGERGRKLVRDVFVALKDGRERDEVYKKVFGKLDAQALEKAWREYVRKL